MEPEHAAIMVLCDPLIFVFEKGASACSKKLVNTEQRKIKGGRWWTPITWWSLSLPSVSPHQSPASRQVIPRGQVSMLTVTRSVTVHQALPALPGAQRGAELSSWTMVSRTVRTSASCVPDVQLQVYIACNFALVTVNNRSMFSLVPFFLI